MKGSAHVEEVAFWSAARVARAIREGELKSRDYLELLLDRISRLDGPLNCVVTLDPDRSRELADAADEAVKRGAALGPLHGVAMTIKDSFQTAGIRTTSGAPELADFVPEVDALPVARLKAAGAIVFGKTNLPIYAGDTQSYNEVFGQSNNPWDPSRTVGGSSGGSAGALAAGFTPLELGSDIGGSIRGPATTCGVFGHKPSYGIVPALGQIPGPPGTLSQADIAVAGPLARDIDDLENALDLLAGPDDWYASAYRLDLPKPRHQDLSKYRVAVWYDEESAPIDPAVRERLEAAAAVVEEAGARVDASARPDFSFDYAIDVFRALLSAATSGGYPRDQMEKLARDGAGRDDELGREWRGASQRHREWLSSNERRLQMRRKWRDFFRDWDAVLLPALPTTAIAHDHSKPQASRTIEVGGESRPYLEQTYWVGLTGVAFLPATVAPLGLSPNGLPVGVQIAGPFLEDKTTIQLARLLTERIGGFEAPPGFEVS